MDFGYNTACAKKTHTVTHQTAVALAEHLGGCSYEVANFAVDGATTADLMKSCHLNKVIHPHDEDHTASAVKQLDAVAAWRPEVAVLSVAGNKAYIRTSTKLFAIAV